MRRFAVAVTLFAGLSTLLLLPLTSSGQSKPRLSDSVKGGLNQTLNNVNTVAEKLREQQRRLRELALRRQREAAQRRVASPRQGVPGPQGTAYVPPLHGTNPHGQGTAATQELPPQAARPQPNDPTGPGELIVVGRSRGEQLDNGTYRGHITIAALAGNDVIPPVTTNPGETENFAPLAGLLTPVCNATQICLTLLNARSTTTANGSTNHFETATASLGGPTGVNAGAATSNGNITEDANCQAARGDSNVADARVGGPTGLAADAIEATNDSRECKDGTRTNTATSKVVNLQNAGLAVPPLISQACANGVPNTPALVNVLLPAVCNANDSDGAQADPTYGVREGLTAFVLNIGQTALTKTTTAAAESRARKRAQCSDGVDNDGDGRIDFPADPDCTGPTDDSEAPEGGRPECSDGVDNDGDGRTDFPSDPDCTSANDDSESGRDRGDAECEDGRDNDGDGRVDFPDDPGCSSRRDDSEDGGGTAGAGGGGAGGGGNGAECQDGIDNDGDGKVDHPDDPGCSSPTDDSEGGGGNLAFTGTNVVLAGLIGSLLLLMGLGLRSMLRSRREPGLTS